jgi:hypothetical protein
MLAMKSLPKVQLTGVFRQALIADELAPDEFAQYFAEWRQSWPNYEFTDPYFGKDGDYAQPLRNGKRVLRHVHLEPPLTSPKYETWQRAAKRCSRKTSDKMLVYAYDPAHGYLLLHIAHEPNGHALGDMDTPGTKLLMNTMADVADAFIFNGCVLI